MKRIPGIFVTFLKKIELLSVFYLQPKYVYDVIIKNNKYSQLVRTTEIFSSRLFLIYSFKPGCEMTSPLVYPSHLILGQIAV